MPVLKGNPLTLVGDHRPELLNEEWDVVLAALGDQFVCPGDVERSCLSPRFAALDHPVEPLQPYTEIDPFYLRLDRQKSDSTRASPTFRSESIRLVVACAVMLVPAHRFSGQSEPSCFSQDENFAMRSGRFVNQSQ